MTLSIGRRRFLQHTLLGAAAFASGVGVAGPGKRATTVADGDWRMPDEGEPHACTWMAFGVRRVVAQLPLQFLVENRFVCLPTHRRLR